MGTSGRLLTVRPQAVLRRIGLSVTRSPAPLSLPWHLQRVLAHHLVTTVFDVGANDGGFGHLLRRQVGYQHRIESFEPFPATFDSLQRTVHGDRLWTAHAIALGDREETAELNVFGTSDLNSLHQAASAATTRFPALAERSSIPVPVRRLDEVVPSVDGPAILKTDTQGHDLAVLRGAEGLMPSLVAVLVELSIIPLYDDTPRWQAVIEFLDRAGFAPIGMVPVSRTGLLVNEMDAVFVRRPRQS